MKERRVVVIGCGSIGSHAAAALVSSGVGQLILIDPDALESSNVCRHLLGMADVGRLKVEALRERLRERFPLTSIEALPRRIQDVLEAHPDVVTSADLILVALGEETLELRLNDYFALAPRRIHVWLEPLGLGGHILGTGIAGRPGCLRCLYRRDGGSGIINMASFAAPNQHFQRNLGGCRGTFTPYGCLDAQRAAIEAVREAIHLLREEDPEPVLISWVVSPAAFLESGFKMSQRGLSIAPGTMEIRHDLARPECKVCGTNSS